MTARRILFAAIAASLSTAIFAAPSNVSPTAQFAWSENAGWMNFLGNVTNGVLVSRSHLEGYAWCENLGWINLGDGSPTNGISYSQASGDTGVNRDDATGFLTGFAWGENIGWVNFDTSTAGAQRAAIDASGHFVGFAWGENIGWINLANASGVAITSFNAPDDWTVF